MSVWIGYIIDGGGGSKDKKIGNIVCWVEVKFRDSECFVCDIYFDGGSNSVVIFCPVDVYAVCRVYSVFVGRCWTDFKGGGRGWVIDGVVHDDEKIGHR